MRLLTVVERRVPDTERGAFLATLADRRASAHAVNAQLWVFEHHEQAGRFMEFTEAFTAADVARAHGAEWPVAVWREVLDA